MEQADLRDSLIASPSLRKRRGRLLRAPVLYVVVAVFAIDQASSGGDRLAGYLAAGIVTVAVVQLETTIRCLPAMLARRRWKARPQSSGQHRDTVNADGVHAVMPEAVELRVPWSAISRVKETERSFLLFRCNDEGLLALPRRGLLEPELVPLVRNFLSQRSSGKARISGED